MSKAKVIKDAIFGFGDFDLIHKGEVVYILDDTYENGKILVLFNGYKRLIDKSDVEVLNG